VKRLGARFDGVIVARLAPEGRELALGARMDPQFGPVVLVGDGGIYLEALKDFRLLLPPFSTQDVIRKLGELRVAPLLAGCAGSRLATLRPSRPWPCVWAKRCCNGTARSLRSTSTR
jgi:hypothetical protein